MIFCSIHDASFQAMVFNYALFGSLIVISVHKKRDVVPLNINEDAEESDEDAEQPVLDFEVEPLVSFFGSRVTHIFFQD